MSDMTTIPPAAPPATPPGGPPQLPPVAFQQPGGDPNVGSPRVTRNVPPRKVMVNNGTVTYGGQSYGPGETFVMGDGPAADGLAMLGQVTIVEYDATDEWNGPAGDKIRKAAHAHLDALAKADPNTDSDKRAHDHGFEPYKHAAPGEPADAEYTSQRQRMAQEQYQRNITADQHFRELGQDHLAAPEGESK